MFYPSRLFYCCYIGFGFLKNYLLMHTAQSFMISIMNYWGRISRETGNGGFHTVIASLKNLKHALRILRMNTFTGIPA